LEVAEPSPIELEPGSVIASRFEVGEAVAGERSRRAFLGTDKQDNGPVLIVELTSDDIPRFERARSATHAHLARVIDVIATPTGGVLIAEHPRGDNLSELLQQIIRKTSVDAVRSALRIADAVSALHAQGAVHGWLEPAAIIPEPQGHPKPMVTWLPPSRESSPFRSRARGESGTPSEGDDTWAVTALLHLMLAGEPPPADGIGASDELFETEIADEALRTALRHGLSREEEQRVLDLRPLKRELARWFVEHAGDETSHSGHPHSRPPPLPAGTSSSPPTAYSSVMPLSQGNVPALTSSKPPTSARAPRRLVVVLGAALVVGLVAAWGVSAFRSRQRVQVVEVAAPGAAEPSGKDKEIALNEIPVTGQSNQLTGDKMATCVAGYLPKGAFAKPPDVSWMCSERDPREGGMKLRAAVVQGAPVGAPTDAMKLFSRLGWYEMAAFAVIRAGCCADSEAITLPDPSPDCKRMDEPLRELGQAVVAGQSHEPALKEFTEAIHCELNAGKAAVYRRAGRPQGGEDSAFQELVKVIQTP
jgi:hypothetical protein